MASFFPVVFSSDSSKDTDTEVQIVQKTLAVREILAHGTFIRRDLLFLISADFTNASKGSSLDCLEEMAAEFEKEATPRICKAVGFHA